MDKNKNLKAIKLRLYPSQDQEAYIKSLVGSCRFVYNSCLEFKIKSYTDSKKNVSFGELGKYLVELKNKEEFSWLKNSHSKVLQQTLINLDTAYKSFFKNGTGFPKFKSKKNNKQSCRFPVDAIGKIHGNQIDIIKQLKNIHFKCSIKDEKYLNRFQNKIKSGTLTLTKSDNFYFSILIERIDTKPTSVSKNEIGLDMGINHFLVDSNGKKYENLKIIRKHQKKLSKLQKSISKKKLGSNNRKKAILKLGKFHEKLTNKKDHYLHKVSNEIIKDNQLIIIEDLNVKDMMKNKYLARSIGELSLNKFKTILSYKCDWNDKELIEIDRYYPSSKLCGKCYKKNEELSLDMRDWVCKNCGEAHDRDINAARNILKEGIRIKKLGLSSPELTLGEIEDISIVEPRKECDKLDLK